MRRICNIILLAALMALSACRQEGSRAAGEPALSDQEQVRFVFRSEPPFVLSTNASLRLLSTLRSDAKYIDGRGLTALAYGKFVVAGRDFFLFHGLICDDVYLHGRAWRADWIDAGFAFWSTNGLPETAGAWQLSLESLLSGNQAQQGAAGNSRPAGKLNGL